MIDHMVYGRSVPPIDVVVRPDGTLVALDNTRLLAASLLERLLPVRLHEAGELLPDSLEFKTRFQSVRGDTKGKLPVTYGEALEFRIQGQSKAFRSANPDGAPATSVRESTQLPAGKER